MKLGIVIGIIGFLGMLLMFLPAVEFGDADIYANPWVLVIGIVFFIMFLFGLYRFRQAMRKTGEERYRRK